MENKKKTLRIIVAMCLVAVVSVAGTLAYLSTTTGPVTNTFTSGKLIDGDDSFKLTESKANPKQSGGKVVPGEYVLDEDDQVTANSYELVPGVQNVPKDPRVTIVGNKLKQDGYLFIEVVNTNMPSTITWSVDSANWTLLTGKTGSHGGQIYAYKSVVSPATTDQKFFILTGNKFDVSSTYTAPAANTEQTLTFYGYLCQSSGFGSAGAAWDGCFGN